MAGKPVPVKDARQDAVYAGVLSTEAVLIVLCIGLVQTMAALVRVYQTPASFNSASSIMLTANLVSYSTTVSLLPMPYLIVLTR